MGWLVGTCIFLLIGGIALIVRALAPKEEWTDSRGRSQEAATGVRVGGLAVAGLALLGIIGLTIASSYNQIDAGHVGIIKTFGSINGQVGDGPTFVAPWTEVTEVSTKATKREFDHLNAFSAETQDVFVDATLNLAVAPTEVQCLYRTVGSDWYDKLIPPRVAQTLKDETVKYTTVQVAPHREAIRAAVKRRLQAQLTDFRVRQGSCPINIDVQDFLIRNIDFRPEFKQAIERKQIATQDAQTAQNRVAQSTAEADQKVAEAKGDAKATVVRATAQATANSKLARSLTPQLVQYTYIQKIAPSIKTILVPSNAPFILPSSATGG